MQTRFSVMPFVVLLCLPISAFAVLVDPNTGNRACTKCSDLCTLVDQYWQKERGIELWQRYAASTLPPARRKALPATVTDLDSFEKFIYGEELPKTWKNRQLPCENVKEWEQEAPKPPLLPPGGDGTGLETKVFKESCETVYRGGKLEGDNEKKWRATHVCKGSSDAELEHEKVHQEICRATWDANRFLAVKRLSTVRNVAESELQAWRRHRNLLRDEIRTLAKNCGWQPTDRQNADPNSVPSEKQTKKMEERGWQAFDALGGTPP
jgi:hypothetical protein